MLEADHVVFLGRLVHHHDLDAVVHLLPDGMEPTQNVQVLPQPTDPPRDVIGPRPYVRWHLREVATVDTEASARRIASPREPLTGRIIDLYGVDMAGRSGKAHGAVPGRRPNLNHAAAHCLPRQNAMRNLRGPNGHDGTGPRHGVLAVDERRTAVPRMIVR